MRVISLCPSLTELVFDLGRGDDLVGITKFCCHPGGQVGAIEKVGGTKDPKIERILALAPDVVLMNDEENRRADADALAAAGVPIVSSLPRTVEETAAMVRAIGGTLERGPQAERIAGDIEQRAARVRAQAAGQPTVTWAYLIWREPLMSVNADTFVDTLLSLPGGRNVFGASRERYPTISAAELAAQNPARVFLGSEPFPFTAEHADELAHGSGLPRERFVLADGEYLSWHGSRTPAGIDYAEGVIRAARAS